MAGANAVDEPRRLFTVEDANKTLPLVRAIVSDIVKQIQVVRELEQRLASIRALRRKPHGADLYSEEVAQTEVECRQEKVVLDEYLGELNKLGVECKGPDGQCDFPSLRDGREIYLCWKLGEPSVMYWHGVDSGFVGRQRLENEALASTTNRRFP